MNVAPIYIAIWFCILGTVFLFLGLVRPNSRPARKARLTIGGIFLLVSVLLWFWH